MLEKFIRGKEYQSAKYEETRGILELRFGIVRKNYPENVTSKYNNLLLLSI